ncbi:MAG: polyketide cyclase [Ignavibacteriae bacterium HGW-Ignavibacteriae-3]|nr:MAG: polyketide cyclase [Ignavibacteriae bacterium HGW-Ignavibacteriae-3]
MESHKDIARNFLMLTAKGKAHHAFDLYAAADIKHHNVFFKGDAESIITAMDDNARKNPELTLDIKLVIQESNMVAVHSHVKMNGEDPGAALVHIFRFENDKIAELWDLAQPVPADAVNENGMF